MRRQGLGDMVAQAPVDPYVEGEREVVIDVVDLPLGEPDVIVLGDSPIAVSSSVINSASSWAFSFRSTPLASSNSSGLPSRSCANTATSATGETRDGKGFKLELYHGAKFHRDLRLRQGEKLSEEPSLTLEMDDADETGAEALPDLMAELTKRGITPKVAQQISERTQDAFAVVDSLEWGDHLIGMNRERFYNPAGFYVTLVRQNVPVSPDFQTSRARAARQTAQIQQAKCEDGLSSMRLAYDQYCAGELDRFIETTYTPEEFADMVEQRKARLLSNRRFNFRQWQPEAFHEYATAHVRREVSQDVGCPTFQEYLDATRGGALS